MNGNGLAKGLFVVPPGPKGACGVDHSRGEEGLQGERARDDCQSARTPALAAGCAARFAFQHKDQVLPLKSGLQKSLDVTTRLAPNA